MKLGILALQGASAAHEAILVSLGVDVVAVRRPHDLDDIDGLVIPGGESTAMSKLARANGLVEPLAARLAEGLAVFGTCAGMILLACEVADGRDDQLVLGAIDISVRRNGFGRQIDSFEADVACASDSLGPDPMHAIFIRAPVIERVGEGVEVLASLGGDAVACRAGPVVVSSFHPELGADTRLHELFCSMTEESHR